MKKTFVLWILTLVLIIYIVEAQSQIAPTNSIITPFSETQCEGDKCTTSIFSYQKYIDKGNGLELLDETFQDCGDNYCNDQLYAVNLSKNLNNQFISIQNNQIAVTPINIGTTSLSTPKRTSVQGNKVTYHDVIPFVDIEYYYVWSELKEIFVIHNSSPFNQISTTNNIPFTFSISTNQQPFSTTGHVVFTNGNTPTFIIKQATVYDANDQLLERINLTLTGNTLTFEVNTTLLQNPNVTYPIFIDPTVQVIATTDIHIERDDLGVHTLYNSSTELNVGKFLPDSDILPAISSRVAMDWDVSVIPTSSNIEQIELNITAFQNGTGNNNEYSIWNMDLNTTTHDSINTIWIDIGDGDEWFTNVTVIAEPIPLSINLTNATTNLEAWLPNKTWSFGIYSPQGEAAGGDFSKFRPSEYSNAN